MNITGKGFGESHIIRPVMPIRTKACTPQKYSDMFFFSGDYDGKGTLYVFIVRYTRYALVKLYLVSKLLLKIGFMKDIIPCAT